MNKRQIFCIFILSSYIYLNIAFYSYSCYETSYDVNFIVMNNSDELRGIKFGSVCRVVSSVTSQMTHEA